MFETNFFGLAHLCRLVLPGMRKRRTGYIVNISSVGGLVGNPGTGYYAATKFAVEGLSDALSKELKPLGIGVLVVEPGPFRTDWAGRSLLRSKTEIEDYKETAAVRSEWITKSSGNQIGDPVRACAAIIKAVTSDDPPLRLVLGKFGLINARAKLESMKQDFDAWEETSLGADYPETETVLAVGAAAPHMLTDGEVALRLVLAALAGSAVGFERERLLWAAGLRTHMLVCVGACLVMIVSAFGFADILGRQNVILDPSRVAAQVVSGIGFLGAGTILLRGDVIRGLTTAASLWAVAAVGLAIGGGLYFAAGAATAIVLVILAGIKPLEEHFRARVYRRELRIVARPGAMSIEVLRGVLGPHTTWVRQFVVQRGESDDLDDVVVAFARLPARTVEDIAAKLRALDGVVSVEVEGR
jgi:putative Mg2+ transporter-C (MgtC) family protein